jgi:hypothetical protein
LSSNDKSKPKELPTSEQELPIGLSYMTQNPLVESISGLKKSLSMTSGQKQRKEERPSTCNESAYGKTITLRDGNIVSWSIGKDSMSVFMPLPRSRY